MLRKFGFAITMAALCAYAPLSPGRQQSEAKPQTAALVALLRSNNWETRASAYEQLSQMPNALRDSEIKGELFNLLDRENHVTISNAPPAGEHEAYAEYIAELLSTEVIILNRSDARQLCILAHSSYNTDSDFAGQLIGAGKLIAPCLLQMIKSSRRGDRVQAIGMLIRLGAEARDLDSGTIQQIRAITLRSLQDSDDWVQGEAVESVGQFGREGMIPALQKVAETDPSIKQNVARAIAGIESRARVTK